MNLDQALRAWAIYFALGKDGDRHVGGNSEVAQPCALSLSPARIEAGAAAPMVPRCATLASPRQGWQVHQVCLYTSMAFGPYFLYIASSCDAMEATETPCLRIPGSWAILEAMLHQWPPMQTGLG